MLRVDWNVAPKTKFYSRLNFGYEAFKGGWGFVLNNANWPQLPIAYEIHSYGVVNTLLHTFSPTLVMEVTVGPQPREADRRAADAGRSRAQRSHASRPRPGCRSSTPKPIPIADRARTSNFGVAGLALGTPANMPTLGVEGRYPFFGENDIWNSSVNLTKVIGSHNLKAGLFCEYTTRPAARSSAVQRHLQLRSQHRQSRSTPTIPTRTRCSGRSTPTRRPRAIRMRNAQFMNFEWFMQDNWRVKKNLTIDAGIRFYYVGPTKSRGDQLAVFQPDQFNPAQAPMLIQPTTVGGQRRGLNPLTGEILPAVKIGTFAPNSGDAVNGIEVFDEGVLDAPPIQVAPRVGFSWDPTGDGRTAVRGGFGLFPDRFNDDIILQLVELPPLVNTHTANYTTIRDLLSTPLSLSPANTR